MQGCVKLILPGRPVILKNSKQIALNRKTGKPFVRSNDRVDVYKKSAVMILRSQWRGRPAITEPVSMKLTIKLASSHDNENIPDLSNLLQAPEDLLQAAGVILNDRLIENHDGSRRVCLCDGDCPSKQIYVAGAKRGMKKDNCGAVKKCPFECVEIELRSAVIEAPVAGDYRRITG